MEMKDKLFFLQHPDVIAIKRQKLELAPNPGTDLRGILPLQFLFAAVRADDDETIVAQPRVYESIQRTRRHRGNHLGPKIIEDHQIT